MDDHKRTKLQDIFSELNTTPLPRGFYSACKNLDVSVFEYESYVAGLISSCGIHGREIDPKTIATGRDIERRIVECKDKLQQLEEFHRRRMEFAQYLIDCLQDK